MQAAAFVQPRLSLARSLSSRSSTHNGLPTAVRSSIPRLGASKAIVAFKEEERQQARPYKVQDPSAKLVPSFTRRRERAVGRLAMLGVAAMWAGEVLSGLGPMGQLSSETGVPLSWAYGATVALAASQLLLGLNQGSPTFSQENQRDLDRRTKGLTGIANDRISPTQEPGKFSLRLELLLGRAAMLIFAGAVMAEYVWGGQSPLSHAGLINPPMPLSHSPFWLQFGMLLFGLGGLGLYSGFGSREDPDTY